MPRNSKLLALPLLKNIESPRVNSYSASNVKCFSCKRPLKLSRGEEGQLLVYPRLES